MINLNSDECLQGGDNRWTWIDDVVNWVEICCYDHRLSLSAARWRVKTMRKKRNNVILLILFILTILFFLFNDDLSLLNPLTWKHKEKLSFWSCCFGNSLRIMFRINTSCFYAKHHKGPLYEKRSKKAKHFAHSCNPFMWSTCMQIG